MAQSNWKRSLLAFWGRRERGADAPEAAAHGDGASVSLVEGKPGIAQGEKHERVDKLTAREKELCLLLVEGYTLKESAQKLGVKYSTVNTHMNAVYRKLGVNTRAGLIINYRYLVNGKSNGNAVDDK